MCNSCPGAVNCSEHTQQSLKDLRPNSSKKITNVYTCVCNKKQLILSSILQRCNVTETRRNQKKTLRALDSQAESSNNNSSCHGRSSSKIARQQQSIYYPIDMSETPVDKSRTLRVGRLLRCPCEQGKCK